MRIFKVIYLLLTLSLFSSCIDREGFWRVESALVKVGDSSLYPSDVALVIPEALSGEDSIAFASRYIESWSRKQVKFREAEAKVGSSSQDIERLLEEYRRKLLLDRLDKLVIESGVDAPVSQQAIEDYRRDNLSDFKVEKPLVRYRILRYDLRYSSWANLLKLFSSDKSSDMEDLRSICEKNLFTLTQVDRVWGEAEEMFSLLPTIEQAQQGAVMRSSKPQSFTDEQSGYFLRVLSYRDVGDNIPVELTQDKIEDILLKQQQRKRLLEYDEELYRKALLRGYVTFPSSSHIE